MKTRNSFTMFIVLGLLLFALGVPTASVRAEDPPPLPVTHQHFNSVEGPLTEVQMKLQQKFDLMFEAIVLNGQLAAGFEHEVSSKVSGLELQLLNLIDDQRKRPDKPLGLSTVFASVLDLKNTVEAFQQLLRTNEGATELDANELVQRAEMLVRPLAGKFGSKVTTKLAPNLPLVAGKSLAVQQVFVNLMLNAVQQMALKAEVFRWKGRRILEISTSFDEANRAIQVRFADAGPGIHRRLWNKIFTPGFSTRGGNGLGLFIARSFIQSLGGSIQVEESFIPLGTTFLVELPVT